MIDVNQNKIIPISAHELTENFMQKGEDHPNVICRRKLF
jgi:hypothetical protein